MDEVTGDRFIIANHQEDFCATIGHAVIKEDQKTCVISHQTAQILQIHLGDSLSLSPLHPTDSSFFNKERHDCSS
jgi:hypothetical protein